MKYCFIKKCFLSNIDLYSKEPELYYRGNSTQSSLLSIVLSMVCIFIYIILLTFKMSKAYNREDITFYDTNAYKNIPSIDITNELFYGGFSLGGIVDETFYNVKAQYIKRVKNPNGKEENITTDLELEICQLEKFGTKYRHYFENVTLKSTLDETAVSSFSSGADITVDAYGIQADNVTGTPAQIFGNFS